MDLRRLRAGEWIAAAAGVALLILLPIDWYHVEVVPGQGIEGIPDRIPASAWDVFSLLDVLMAVSALLAIGLLLFVAVARSPSTGISAQALSVLFTGVVAIVVLVRLVDLPGAVESVPSVQLDTTRTVAGYLGTLAMVLIPVGLVVALRDERLSKPGRLTDATGVPLSGDPAPIETLPAPRA